MPRKKAKNVLASIADTVSSNGSSSMQNGLETHTVEDDKVEITNKVELKKEPIPRPKRRALKGAVTGAAQDQISDSGSESRTDRKASIKRKATKDGEETVKQANEANSSTAVTVTKRGNKKRRAAGPAVFDEPLTLPAVQSNIKRGRVPTKGALKDFGDAMRPLVQGPLASTPALKRIAEAVGKSNKWIGCHVSASGSVANAVVNAAFTGCYGFAFFLRSPRAWKSKELTDDVVQDFKNAMEKQGYIPSRLVPHGSYLLNVGSSDPEKWAKSRDYLLDEVKRCERLGLELYNFHPGSAVGSGTTEDCLTRIATAINYVLGNTSGVTVLVETMCGQGRTVGGSFAELKAIIDRVDDSERIGVCFDTCHVWAAGYDIKSKEGYAKTMQEFEDVIGLKYLKAVHLNDSMKGKGCHLDRHERIGKGAIGVEGFRNVVNDKRFDGMPMVLETPDGDQYTDEIELLYRLQSEEA